MTTSTDKLASMGFNSQPPEGGWAFRLGYDFIVFFVSTHSRPKAAGKRIMKRTFSKKVSTHSRPKAAGHLT